MKPKNLILTVLAGMGIFLAYKNWDSIKKTMGMGVYPGYGDYSGHGTLNSPTGATGDVSEAFLSDYSDRFGAFPETDESMTIPARVGSTWAPEALLALDGRY